MYTELSHKTLNSLVYTHIQGKPSRSSLPPEAECATLLSGRGALGLVDLPNAAITHILCEGQGQPLNFEELCLRIWRRETLLYPPAGRKLCTPELTY